MLEVQEDNARANTTEKAGSAAVNAKCGPATAVAAATSGPKPDFVRILEVLMVIREVRQTFEALRTSL